MNNTHTEILGVSRKAIRWMAMFTLVALTTLSCTQREEDIIIPPTPVTPEGATDVLFELNIPQSTAPTTYALSKENEDQIKTIEILLFKEDPDDGIKKYTGKPYFCDKIESGTGVNSHLKHFLVSLPMGGPYDIVVLANSRKTVNEHLVDSTPAVTEKKDILKLLTINHTTKWISNPGNDYVPFPMWDELKDKTISVNLKFDILMTRMLAKIDVALTSETIAALNLKKVYLVNANTAGHIVPNEAGIPSLVEDSAINTTPLEYTEASLVGSEFKNVIYTFEAKKATTGTLNQATFIVIMGEYEPDEKDYFYRLDIGKKESDGSITYLDLLRNIKYSINISKIGGPGYGTLEEAIASPSSNIEADLVEWDSNELPIVVWDNNHTLGFSRDTVIVSYVASQANQIKIRTDYPGGWKLKRIIDINEGPVTWLTIPTASGGADDTADVQFDFKENRHLEENRYAIRTCYAEFGAGALAHFVVVTQLPIRRIDDIIWNDYIGDDFKSITIEDDLGNRYTSEVNSSGRLVKGTVPTTLEVAGVITKIVATYKGHALDVPVANYSYASDVITIIDRSLIGLPIHLDEVRNNLAGSYLQVSNVDLSGYENLSGESDNWRPIGNHETPFTGSYNAGAGAAGDGSGFDILDLTIVRPTEDLVALFGVMDGGSLKNIHIASGNIEGKDNVAAICGVSSDSGTNIIDGCTTSAEEVSISGASWVGGIVGSNGAKSTISKCINEATIDATGLHVGGIAASNGGIVKESKNSGEIFGEKDNVGGIVGLNTGTISDCKNNSQSIIIGDSSGTVGAENIGGIVGMNNLGGIIERCTNESEVSGTSDTTPNSGIGGICGENNGIIRGDCLNTGDIYNLSGGKNVGGICGYNNAKSADGGGTITTSVNKGSVKGTGSYIGGIAGNNQSSGTNVQSITDCINEGVIDGNLSVGGIVGENGRGIIARCTNETKGIITGTGAVGGICGSINSGATISNCTNRGNISRTGAGEGSIGGICGINRGGKILYFCRNSGSVSGSPSYSGDLEYIGGICGENNEGGSISECVNSGAIRTSAGILSNSIGGVGGVCGYNNNASINGCQNSSAVEGIANVGGICGYNNNASSMTGCQNSSDVEGITNVGGICGYNNASSMTGCYNFERYTVKARTNVGGICGKNTAAIDNCENGATISGESRIGGICGENKGGSGLIQNSSNKGSVNGIDHTGVVNYVGGICGYNDGQIGGMPLEACKNSGAVTSTGFNTGGICGENGVEGLISNCSNSASINATGKTNLGGISGRNLGKMPSCTNSGYIQGANSQTNIGGICGENANGQISNAINNGVVIGTTTYVGGICGHSIGSNASITSSTNTASIEGINSVGGICGHNSNGQISGALNSGKVIGTGYLGGISGNNYGETALISDCTNEAEITGTENNVGGIAGFSERNGSTITRCRNLAKAIIGGKTDVGGICGGNGNTSGAGIVSYCINEAAIKGTGNSIGGICGVNNNGGTTLACYNIGLVTGIAPIGAVVGFGAAPIINCYYGGNAVDVTPNGAIKFGENPNWPTEELEGWGMGGTTVWANLGKWNGGTATVYPTLLPLTK